jgi:glycosyltransferase involved in cell wall biosynthesis
VKRVLLIAYYFPPLGGAGIARPFALWKHLSSNGYECHVLTVKPVAYRVWEPELLEGLPQDSIYRADSWDPQRLMYLMGIRTPSKKAHTLGTSTSKWFYPDNKRGWIRPATAFGRTLLSNRKYDAIISTSPPMSSHCIALTLAREFNIPWLADFRDKWSVRGLEDVFEGHSRLISRGQILLSDIREKAGEITAVNKSVADYVGKGAVIENSYDTALAGRWRTRVESPTFNIGLFGTFNEMYPIDTLLQLISRLSDSETEKIRLVQVGDVDKEWLQNQLMKYKLESKCDIVGFQGRQTAIDRLGDCSMFYMGTASDKEIGVTHGRIFILLASGRPIIAYTTPKSEVARLIEQSGNGLTFDSATIDIAVEFLRERVSRFERSPEVFECSPPFARRYADTEMVRRFAEVLNQITR